MLLVAYNQAMPGALLQDRPPIEAGPVIVDNWALDHERFPGEYVRYQTFVVEALRHEVDQAGATRATRLALSALIQHLDLPILPPFEEATGDQAWGPYGVHAYYIAAHGYAKHSGVIESYAAKMTDDAQVMTVLECVADWAWQAVRHDTDRIPLKKLPGAFYTPEYPEKRIKRGQVLSFRDFQNAAKGADTSPAKAAAVFDKIVELLGDEEAIEHILKLAWCGNPYSRRDIRRTSYVKTQALANFCTRYAELPSEQQVFNNLALLVIRNILYDEERSGDALVDREE